MSALAREFLRETVGGLTNPAQAGSGNEQFQLELLGYKRIVADILDAIVWVFGQVNGAWHYNQGTGRQIGYDLEQIAGDQDAMWDRLVKTIIPRSLSNLNGYVFSHGIVPLRVDMRKVQASIRFLMGWRGQIDSWRHNTVDPTLQDWRNFHHWFDVNAAPAINTVRDWVAHPDHFATFAVPPIAAPLVAWYANHARDAVVDQLAALVIDASPDVWRHVEAAAVAILDQPQ